MCEKVAYYVGKRKHVSQMSFKEKNKIWNALHSIGAEEWTLHHHAMQRLDEKGINATIEDIVSTIQNATIVEYKIDYVRYSDTYDHRVLLRSKAVVNGHYNLHVVFSLTTKRIISVWMNHVKDKHKTLNMGIYTSNMLILC